jgi:ubiquinol-cytochrome c reductase cytochrome b subunit
MKKELRNETVKGNLLKSIYLIVYSEITDVVSRWRKNFVSSFISNHLIYYGTPINLTYSWSFGSLACVCLVIQITTGIFLAVFYIPHVDLAFASVEFIMRDVKYGWFVRYTHSNGASMFFFILYCHIFRGLYCGSYAQPRELLWFSGVALLIMIMATAFLGYVLPWGQMSFWGASVITSMVAIVPKVGRFIVECLWGGFTVDNPTLNRFFTFHFFLPFVIAGGAFLHLALLHKDSSSAPITDFTGVDQPPLYSYYYAKDLFAIFLIIIFVFLLIPNQLGDSNSYILADSIHTPRHIAPEWYFSPFYAIIRCIPNKVAGIVAACASLLVFLLLPYNQPLVKNRAYRTCHKLVWFIILFSFLTLMWLGQCPVEQPYIYWGQVATYSYFFSLLVLLPLSGALDHFYFEYEHFIYFCVKVLILCSLILMLISIF